MFTYIGDVKLAMQRSIDAQGAKKLLVETVGLANRSTGCTCYILNVENLMRKPSATTFSRITLSIIISGYLVLC